MGKQIPTALLTHYQQDMTTTCLLTRIRTKSGSLYGFTDLDVSVTYNPATVDPGATGDAWGSLVHTADNGGFSMARLEAAADLNINNTELSGVIGDTGITQQQVRAGLFDFSDVRIYRVNYMDLTQGHELIAAGVAGETTYTENGWKTEFRSLTQILKQPETDMWTIACPKQFGSATYKGSTGCPKAFTWTSGTVTSLGTDTQRQFSSALAPADGYYTIGVVVWDTGDNAGAQMEVDSNISGLFSLSLPMDNAIKVGDTFRVRKDCNKVYADSASGCQFHWGAADRNLYFGGCPDIPVTDGGASLIPGAQIGSHS
jgi:uncharacterized phage protein (TIGR02218 family)